MRDQIWYFEIFKDSRKWLFTPKIFPSQRRGITEMDLFASRAFHQI